MIWLRMYRLLPSIKLMRSGFIELWVYKLTANSIATTIDKAICFQNENRMPIVGQTSYSREDTVAGRILSYPEYGAGFWWIRSASSSTITNNDKR